MRKCLQLSACCALCVVAAITLLDTGPTLFKGASSNSVPLDRSVDEERDVAAEANATSQKVRTNRSRRDPTIKLFRVRLRDGVSLELPSFPPCASGAQNMFGGPTKNPAKNSVNCRLMAINRPVIAQTHRSSGGKQYRILFSADATEPLVVSDAGAQVLFKGAEAAVSGGDELFAPMSPSVAHFVTAAVNDFALFKLDWVFPHNFFAQQPAASLSDVLKHIVVNGSIGEKKQKMSFRYALVLPEPSCFTNLWHGFLENVLTVFDLLVRSGLLIAARKGEVAILFEMPRRNGWAPMNAGCPSRNNWPYGISRSHWVGSLFLAMLGVSEDAALDSRVMFYNEIVSSKYISRPFTGPVEITKRAVIGQPRTCVPEYFVNQLNKGPKWPYLSDEAQHPHGAYCRQLLKSFRAMILAEHGLLASSSEVVSAAERRCPFVVIVRRPVAASGRVILNLAEVREAIVSVLDGQCPEKKYEIREVFFENMTVVQQIELMLRTTILIAARGAGMVNALFLRPESGTLSLSIANKHLPVAPETDQYPFYPFISVLDRHHVVISNCVASVGISASYNCLHNSVNYCEMNCGVEFVHRAMFRLLRAMKEQRGTHSLTVPPVTTRNGQEFYNTFEWQ